MTSVVLAEHDGNRLLPATACAVTAACRLGVPVHILVAGEHCRAAADAAARLAGVDRVLLADGVQYRHGLAEPVAALMATLLAEGDSAVAAATAAGASILPRLAALLDTPQVSNVIEIINRRTFRRTIYAGSFQETVAVPAGRTVVTIQAAAFPPAGSQPAADINNIQYISIPCYTSWVQDERPDTGMRPPLETAKIIVGGGRGVGGKDGFTRLEAIADRLGAAVGASRAAVDGGLVSNACQLGQNGKVVAPDLYIALGISGAMQHMAGVMGARLIAAVNKDEEAPIFRFADIGLVADLDAVWTELEAELDKFGL